MPKGKPKTPRLGDPILGPPSEIIVTDPNEIEEALKDTISAIAERVAVKLSGPNILLEDGTRVPVFPDQQNAYRVYGIDHTAYDHCHDTPDGEWIYRKA